MGGNEELPDDWTTTANAVRETARKAICMSSKQRKEDKDIVGGMRKCKKAYGTRDWRRRRGIYRGMKRVNKSIRRCDESKRKRWRMPRARHMMSYTRGCTLRKEKRHCTDWRDKDTKRERTYNRMMKDKDGNEITDEESVLMIWKGYYMELINEENERARGENDGERVNWKWRVLAGKK